MITHSLFTFRLNYCNKLYVGLAKELGELATGTSNVAKYNSAHANYRFDHITPITLVSSAQFKLLIVTNTFMIREQTVSPAS